MTASSHLPAPNLMPLMRYRDLAEAMGWLERAFGFEKQIAVSDSDGAVIYGQMTYRGSLMMMGAVRDTDLDKLMRQPDEVGGVETQSCYLVVEDADAHYTRAQEAGAEIVLELKSDGLGRRGYSCRDPEGHIWNFGTYNPAKGLTMTVASPAAEPAEPPRRSPRMLMGLAALFLAVGATWWLADDIRTGLASRFGSAAEQHAAREAEKAYAELVKVRAEKRKADEAAEAATKALEAERARRLALESNAGSASEKLAQEETARRAAEAAVATLRAELERKQEALDAAVEAKRISEEKLAVKSASAEAPLKAAEPARGMAPAAPGASGIETSATRPASEERSAKADEITEADDEADESRSVVARRARQSRPSLRRNKSVLMQTSKPRYPLYVIDLRHTWPYSGWTK
jgi:uncharacterized glyoxalase superfamily protein PhnB